MKKIKQILAILAIVALAICAVLTLIFALLTYLDVGDYSAAWKASAWSMVILPGIIYAMLLMYRVLDNRNE